MAAAAVIAITVSTVVKMLEGETNFKARMAAVLTGVVGGAIAGGLIGHHVGKSQEKKA